MGFNAYVSRALRCHGSTQPPHPARAIVTGPVGSAVGTAFVVVVPALAFPIMAEEPRALRATNVTPATMLLRRRFQLVPFGLISSFMFVLVSLCRVSAAPAPFVRRLNTLRSFSSTVSDHVEHPDLETRTSSPGIEHTFISAAAHRDRRRFLRRTGGCVSRRNPLSTLTLYTDADTCLADPVRRKRSP